MTKCDETKMSTIFVVDDNDDFRASVAWMLRGEGRNTIEFDCPKKAINALSNAMHTDLEHSCVLLDVRMPYMSGLEFHEALRQKRIPLPVIYMTGHADVELAVESMKKGAITFLEKPLNPEKLNSAIESALVSSAALNSGELGVKVDAQHLSEFQRLMNLLTPRENDVLNGIVEGNPNKIIASKLNISIRTVEVHRYRVMRKLNTRSTPELVKLALMCQARI